jgi:LemA protein
MAFYIVLGLIAAIALYAITLYNGLVKNKNLVEEGWSGIDVQLKRRADLIPNLIETVKGYAAHEKGVFEGVSEARARSIAAGNVADQAAAEKGLTAALGKLFAIAEAYPELKADENFRDLQKQLGSIEEEVQGARRYYNAATRNLNTMVESFPSNLIANQFRFSKAEFFELDDEAARQVPKVSF